MKQLILAGLLAFCCSFAIKAQNSSVKERTTAYINAHKDIAISEMLRTGVPASIKLAQGILESTFGESDLARRSNNHFGIKCKTEWTGDKTYHDDDAKGECFRVYNTVEESYRDHSDFLKTRAHYAFLFQLDPTDHSGWAYGLKKAGYATSKTYPERLLRVIEEYQLNQYTLQALALRDKQANPDLTVNNAVANTATNEETRTVETPVVTVAKETTTTPVTTSVTQNTQTPEVTPVVKQEEKKEEAPPAVAVQEEDTPTTPSPYPDGVFNINHTKAIYARQGTSLLALASMHGLSLSKLFDFNDIPQMDILDTDRLLFIERKQKKGAADVHEVGANETLHEISQKEGIRLESLLEYNKLKKDSKLAAGQKLFLRSPAEINRASGKQKNKSTK